MYYNLEFGNFFVYEVDFIYYLLCEWYIDIIVCFFKLLVFLGLYFFFYLCMRK